ncbi:MAG: lysophospholipase [Anaerolineae bacterium]|nr:lysophospholipase [Anaerolineae bacterium]MCI0611175.1 lysophospholipase [Anaerolineae bacterium]
MITFESKWEGSDGVPFYIRGWEPNNKNPKALLALIHGLGEHTGRYIHAGKTMTDAGYALVGFDLRGHGKSGGPRGHFPSLNAIMQDIRQFFKFLVQRYPDIPHFLYGHSLGGLLSLTYALQYNTGLNGVMVTGAGLRSPLQEQKGKLAMVNTLGTLLPAITVPSGLDPTTISRDADVVKKYNNDPLVHDKTSLGLGKSAIKAIEFCFTHAQEFKPPLLIMHGAADKLTYPSGSEDFARLAGENNKDVTLKLWDGLYHEVHNEPEKAEVFKVMIDWLEKRL